MERRHICVVNRPAEFQDVLRELFQQEEQRYDDELCPGDFREDSGSGPSVVDRGSCCWRAGGLGPVAGGGGTDRTGVATIRYLERSRLASHSQVGGIGRASAFPVHGSRIRTMPSQEETTYYPHG